MINRVHALIHRPERGWDPVPPQHVENYALAVGADESILDLIEQHIGGFHGRRILDLGAGPGHYSIAFAKRGADVYWYDVSHRYMRIAQQRAAASNISLHYEIGYLDEAYKKLRTNFDFVFCNICFYYGWSDAGIANVIIDLIAPGGIGYIDTNNADWAADSNGTLGHIKLLLNRALSIKIGHPFPPKGRIERLFKKMGTTILMSDYSRIGNDLIIIRKPGTADGR